MNDLHECSCKETPDEFNSKEFLHTHISYDEISLDWEHEEIFIKNITEGDF